LNIFIVTPSLFSGNGAPEADAVLSFRMNLPEDPEPIKGIDSLSRKSLHRLGLEAFAYA
jgi:hypothetical protein